MQVPGKMGAEDRAGRLLPAVDRVLVVRPPLPVFTGFGEVEDRRVDVELRVVLAAGAVDEGGAHQVRRHWPCRTVLADTGITAMAEHRVFQRCARGIDGHALDLRTHLRLGDGPQRGDALVDRKGHVDAGGAARVSCTLHELACSIGSEAVVEPLELAGVHLRPVFQAEQAVGVEPRPVGFLAGGVVLVRMPVGALALQVILGGRHLADGGYHFEAPPPMRPTETPVLGLFTDLDTACLSTPGSGTRRYGPRHSETGSVSPPHS